MHNISYVKLHGKAPGIDSESIKHENFCPCHRRLQNRGKREINSHSREVEEAFWVCTVVALWYKPTLVFSSAVLQLFEHDGSAEIVYLLCVPVGPASAWFLRIWRQCFACHGPRGFSMWIQSRKSSGNFFWNRSHHSKAFPLKILLRFECFYVFDGSCGHELEMMCATCGQAMRTFWSRSRNRARRSEAQDVVVVAIVVLLLSVAGRFVDGQGTF